MQYFENLRKLTFEKARSEDPGRFTGTLEEWKNDNLQGGKNILLKRMMTELVGEAERVKIEVPISARAKLASPGSMNFDSDQELAGQYFSLAGQVASRGGNTMPNMDAVLRIAEAQHRVSSEHLRAFNEFAKAQEEAKKKGQALPAPLNGPPQPWNGRP